MRAFDSQATADLRYTTSEFLTKVLPTNAGLNTYQ